MQKRDPVSRVPFYLLWLLLSYLVHRFDCLLACLVICPFVCVSMCLCFCVFVPLCVCVCVCVPVCLRVRPSTCQSVSLCEVQDSLFRLAGSLVCLVLLLRLLLLLLLLVPCLLPAAFCAAAKHRTVGSGTALRIDTFLKGDWGSISKALRAEGLDETLEGAKE